MVIALMLIPFSVCMYLIWTGGAKKQKEGDRGMNLTIPEAKESGMEATRQKAIDKVSVEDKRAHRIGEDDFSLIGVSKGPPIKQEATSVGQSQRAYRAASRELQEFYAPVSSVPQPKVEPSTEPQAQRLDPLELAERQYQLAAKYLRPNTETLSKTETKKSTIQVVGKQSDPVHLLWNTADEQRVDNGFHTPVGEDKIVGDKNIRACIDTEQVVASGQRLSLRLLEDVKIGSRVVSVNSLLYGTVHIEGQRLHITIAGVEQNGAIVPVELTAYDTDGQKGLYIPNSAERTALKEAAAKISSGLGSGISFFNNASQQIAMDVARGVTQGGSQYVASKLREVKICVKANYPLLLISKE